MDAWGIGVAGWLAGGLVVLAIGLALPRRKCPECGDMLPRIRKPTNERQVRWGGATCAKCGCESDRDGVKINGSSAASTIHPSILDSRPQAQPPQALCMGIHLDADVLAHIMRIAALLLGAALDALRASGAVLAAQNLDLELANRDLDRLGTELRDAAQRNLRMEKIQRHRLAAEIHDELGQNLTAVHTRIRLAADRLDAAQLGDVSSSIIDILGTMRRSVHGLMDTLRPPALDEFGLLRALAEGPLRDMVEQAGMRYTFASAGEPSLVDALREDTQIAIWRIVQESTTNSVRHARARRFDARLRIGIRGPSVWAILDLRDDGIGVDADRDHSNRNEGLQGLRDRVLALDGATRLTSSADGTRLHVLLRQAI